MDDLTIGLTEARYNRELIDRIELSLTDTLDEEASDQKSRVIQDHLMHHALQNMEAAMTVMDTKFNSDYIAQAKDALALTGTIDEKLAAFNANVALLSKAFPDTTVSELEYVEARPLTEEAVARAFTGSEAFGRFIDLTSQHATYLALPLPGTGEAITYVDYLGSFHQINPFAKKGRYTDPEQASFMSYTADLKTKLEEFAAAADPRGMIFNISPDAMEVEATQGVAAVEKARGEQGPMYCAFCGQTLHAAAVESHYKGKAHNKRCNWWKKTHGDTAPSLVSDAERDRIAAVHRISYLRSALSSIIDGTIEDQHRRAGLTAAELAADVPTSLASGTGTGEARRRRRLISGGTMRLGPQGQPMLEWQWQLAGLHLERPCEICGGHVYRGDAAFSAHFSEARHVAGLQALGMEYSAALHGVTDPTKARALWDVRQSRLGARFDPKRHGEVETADGTTTREEREARRMADRALAGR